MANIIKIKRGLSSDLSKANLQEGEIAFTTDTKKLYVSTTAAPINENTTYKLTKSGSTITLTGSDGTTTSVTDSNTTYTHPTSAGNKHIPSGGEAGQILRWSAAGTAVWGADNNTTYSNASTSVAGLMSASDKTKLDGIASGATKNTASSTTPKANGTAAVGSESNYARGDHVHPAQTTITGNAGTATTLATARTIAIGEGATGTATSFNGSQNITIPITSMKEAYINWGGKARSGGITPTDAGCSDIHSANKFQFAYPAGITIQYSRDKGATWTDYSTTDQEKIKLVSNIGSAYYIGGRSTGTTVQDQLRITLNATNMGLYTSLQKLLINISTNYATGSSVMVERAMKGSTSTYTVMGTYSISGWPGWNSIPIGYAFGGGATQTGNIDNIRLTFSITGINTAQTSNALVVLDILAIGMTNWSNPSTMARIGHLYSFDYAQNATFPAGITATSFAGSGASLTTLNASNISSGTLSADRLATSGVTAGSYGPTANITGTNGTTMNVPQITVDNKGRVTSVVNRVYTSKDTTSTNVVVSTTQPTASTAQVWINPNATSEITDLQNTLEAERAKVAALTTRIAELEEDTGWVNLSLASGCSAQSAKIRRKAGITYLQIQNLTGWSTNVSFCTIPEGFRPTGVQTTGSVYRWIGATTGTAFVRFEYNCANHGLCVYVTSATVGAWVDAIISWPAV